MPTRSTTVRCCPNDTPSPSQLPDDVFAFALVTLTDFEVALVVDFFVVVLRVVVFLVVFFLVGLFLAGPLARFSASNSWARSGVMSSTESSLRRVALVWPSVT